MKRPLMLLLVLWCSLTLFALDVVSLRDGTILSGEVSSYASLGQITILQGNGSTTTLPSKEVLSIKKQGEFHPALTSSANSFIHYHEGDRSPFYYLPPRYTYRGVSYNMDTDWAMQSDVAEFFAYLREEHPDMDDATLSLIQELEKNMKRQNITMAIAGVCVGVGTVMTFLPLNLDDLQATPNWAVATSISGFSLNIIGVGSMLYSAFIQHRQYPALIADSFNAFIARKNRIQTL